MMRAVRRERDCELIKIKALDRGRSHRRDMLRNTPALWLLLSFAVIALCFVLREHWGHALGFLPYLLLLLCPLMQVFHGPHGHRHHQHAPTREHKL
jgi:hypothetical protein